MLTAILERAPKCESAAWAKVIASPSIDEIAARVELVRRAEQAWCDVQHRGEEWHARVTAALSLAEGVVARTALDRVDRDGLQVALGWVTAFNAIVTANVITREYAIELVRQSRVTYEDLAATMNTAGVGVHSRTLMRWIKDGVTYPSPHDPTSQLLRRKRARALLAELEALFVVGAAPR